MISRDAPTTMSIMRRETLFKAPCVEGGTHPEVMQSTADLHHNIPDARLPQPDPVFDDATALDTAVDMLNAEPTLVQCLVGDVLLQRQFLAAGFLGGHADLHLGQRERQEAQIL